MFSFPSRSLSPLGALHAPRAHLPSFVPLAPNPSVHTSAKRNKSFGNAHPTLPSNALLGTRTPGERAPERAPVLVPNQLIIPQPTNQPASQPPASQPATPPIYDVMYLPACYLSMDPVFSHGPLKRPYILYIPNQLIPNQLIMPQPTNQPASQPPHLFTMSTYLRSRI